MRGWIAGVTIALAWPGVAVGQKTCEVTWPHNEALTEVNVENVAKQVKERKCATGDILVLSLNSTVPVVVFRAINRVAARLCDYNREVVILPAVADITGVTSELSCTLAGEKH